MLEDMGVIDYSGDIEYDVCPCRRHIYRCEYRNVQHCPQCDTPRSNSVTYIYSGISTLLCRYYSVPVLAKAMADWQSRRDGHDADLIEDVTDGHAWGSIIDSDPRFAVEPRHVGLSMFFDPFQVRKGGGVYIYGQRV